MLRVGILQLRAVDDAAVNVSRILSLLSPFASRSAAVTRTAADDTRPSPLDLVCLPENALFFRISPNKKFQPVSSPDSPLFDPLSAFAQESGIALHIGSVPMQQPSAASAPSPAAAAAEASALAYSSSILLWPDGRRQQIYSKSHLFDVHVEGEPTVRESAVFLPGPGHAVFALKGFLFGCSICYDLRFADFFTEYARRSVDAILVPSAFLPKTGQAHWEPLLRARAIENQCYVLAPAIAGTRIESTTGDGSHRSTWGHSMAVDPWGTVLVDMADDTSPASLEIVQLEKSHIEKVRRQIPMQRRKL